MASYPPSVTHPGRASNIRISEPVGGRQCRVAPRPTCLSDQPYGRGEGWGRLLTRTDQEYTIRGPTQHHGCTKGSKVGNRFHPPAFRLLTQEFRKRNRIISRT